MKNHKILLSICCILFLMSSCQENKFDDHLLTGDWKLKEWKELESGKAINNAMDMSFKDDGTYVIDYGSEKESGKFWIASEYLHTVETGKAEKKVKILTLSSDSLQFQMNRGGYLENVLLLKQ